MSKSFFLFIIIIVVVQIVSTGEDEENAFNFNEENLETILGKIPPKTKVAVVSVVGAFRTGKVSQVTRLLNANSVHKIITFCEVKSMCVVLFYTALQSFLLTFFLRYLRYGNVNDLSLDWMTESKCDKQQTDTIMLAPLSI